MLIDVSLRHVSQGVRACRVANKHPRIAFVLLQRRKREEKRPYIQLLKEQIFSVAGKTRTLEQSGLPKPEGISESRNPRTNELNQAQHIPAKEPRTHENAQTGNGRLGLGEGGMLEDCPDHPEVTDIVPDAGDAMRAQQSSSLGSLTFPTVDSVVVVGTSPEVGKESEESPVTLPSMHRISHDQHNETCPSVLDAKTWPQSSAFNAGDDRLTASVSGDADRSDAGRASMLHRSVHLQSRASGSYGTSAPHETLLPQNCQLTAVNYACGRSVKDSMQVLKAISFAEALDAFRSGHADLLDPVSVLAGWHQHNEHRRNVLRQSDQMFSRLDRFDRLLIIITVKTLVGPTTCRRNVIGKLWAVLLHLYPCTSQAVATLVRTKNTRSRRSPTSKPTNRAVRNAILYWIRNMSDDWVVAGELSSYNASEQEPSNVCETQSELKSKAIVTEAWYGEVLAKKFPQLPPSVIAYITHQRNRVRAITQFIHDDASRDLVVQAIRHAIELAAMRQRSDHGALQALQERGSGTASSITVHRLQQSVEIKTKSTSRLEALLASLLTSKGSSTGSDGDSGLGRLDDSIKEHALHSAAAKDIGRSSDVEVQMNELNNINDRSLPNGDIALSDSLRKAIFDMKLVHHSFEEYIRSAFEKIPNVEDKQAALTAFSTRLHIEIQKVDNKIRQGLNTRPLRRRLAALHTSQNTMRDFLRSLEAEPKRSEKPMKLPDQVQRLLDAGHLCNLATLKIWSGRLPKEDKHLLWMKVIERILFGLRRARRVGPRSEVRLWEQRLKDVPPWLNSQQRRLNLSFDRLLAERPVSRFTGKVHADFEDEIRAVKEWREDEQRKLAATHKRYKLSMSEASDRDTGRNGEALKRQMVTSQMQLVMVATHLAQLRKELSSDTPEVRPYQGATEQFNWRGKSTQPDSEPATTESTSVPYSMLHYVLQDVLYAFKQAMLFFGRREFHDIMRNYNWDSVESVSIKSFMHVMSTDPDIRERMSFAKDEFESLRLLRNAHAHEISDFDVNHTVGLLDDLYIVAIALDMPHLKVTFDKYKDLLKEYEANFVPKRLELWHKTSVRLKKLEAEHQERQSVLEKNELELRQHLEQMRIKKAHFNDNFERKSANISRESRLNEATIASRAVQQLRQFTLEREINRLLKLLPAPSRTEMVHSLYITYGATTQDDTNQDLPQEQPLAQSGRRGSLYRFVSSPIVVEQLDTHAGYANLGHNGMPGGSTAVGDEVDRSTKPPSPDEVAEDIDPGYNFLRGEEVNRFTMRPSPDEAIEDIDPSYNFLRGEEALGPDSNFEEDGQANWTDSALPNSSEDGSSGHNTRFRFLLHNQNESRSSDKRSDADESRLGATIIPGESYEPVRRYELPNRTSGFAPTGMGNDIQEAPPTSSTQQVLVRKCNVYVSTTQRNGIHPRIPSNHPKTSTTHEGWRRQKFQIRRLNPTNSLVSRTRIRHTYRGS